MFQRFFLTFFFIICNSAPAYACSCAYFRTFSEIIDSGATAVLASPVGTADTYFSDNSVHPSRLRVWRTYSGEAEIFEDINVSTHSSCSIRFPQNKISLIIAYRNDLGTLQTGTCHLEGFSRAQWLTFFETGADVLPRDRCFMEIKKSYDAKEQSGEFNLEISECFAFIPEYDASFKR